MRIAVYGTLRKGMPLHGYLTGAKFLGEDWIEGFELYFKYLPKAVRGKGRIKVEVYEVNEETFRAINEMEIESGYKPIEINTKFGKAVLWEWPSKVDGAKVESGDLVEYFKKVRN